MMMDIKVLVVDDQPLMSQALSIFVDAAADMRCVGAASDGHDALCKVKKLKPDVVLMDMQMPGMNGIEATAAIVGLQQAIAVIGVTTFEISDYMMPALKAGARGFLLKDATPEEVVQAVRTAYSGSLAMAPRATEHLLQLATEASGDSSRPRGIDPAVERPTTREMEVLQLLSKGASNRDLACQLFVAETTVKAHISRLMAKFQAANRVELVVKAVQSGTISIE